MIDDREIYTFTVTLPARVSIDSKRDTEGLEPVISGRFHRFQNQHLTHSYLGLSDKFTG